MPKRKLLHILKAVQKQLVTKLSQSPKHMNVSVVIPAYNAQETIALTLESVIAQTFSHWEAIVVDDGSTDDTLTIAKDFAQKDSRIRVISQKQMGVSVARNTGINNAVYDWLLFLDSDDWILPQHLERLTEAIERNPHLDAVYGGWVEVTPDGESSQQEYSGEPNNIFAALSSFCVLAIHCCIVRRAIVLEVGGFDPSLRTCEDWDLWQRIARTGARFGSIPDALAYYQLRVNSASRNTLQMFIDELRVIATAHSCDPRVPNPCFAYANGMPTAYLPDVQLHVLCGAAGLLLGDEQNPLILLSYVKQEQDPGLSADTIASCFFWAILLPHRKPASVWDKLWFEKERQIKEFLKALEAQSKAATFTERVCKRLETMIVEHSKAPRPLTFGSTYAISLEVTQPILDVTAPPTSERLHCAVTIEGKPLGDITLPICDGFVPAFVLKDAIAAKFTWAILEHYFQNTVYCQLTLKRTPTGLSIWRDSVCLASGLQCDEQTLWSEIHNTIGWTVFLQELWGLPQKNKDYFYTYFTSIKGILRELKADIKNLFSKGWIEEIAETLFAPKRLAENGKLTVEITQKLPNVIKNTKTLLIIPTISGVPLGTMSVEGKAKLVSAQQLRVAIITQFGFELAVAAVREGLLGKPIAHATLRPFNENQPEEFLLLNSESELSRFPIQNYTTDSAVVFARHRGALGTSISRRAMLPQQAIPDLMETAEALGEPVVKFLGSGNKPQRVIYAPEIIWFPLTQASTSTQKLESQSPPNQLKTITLRERFETLFARQPDSWKYTTFYEQKKYEQTLELIPSIQFEQVLELACAEGHFTVQLAPRVGNLIAVDISQVALSRAQARCADQTNVHFQLLDLTKDPIPGKFDLIICSEVLYYIDGIKDLESFARRVADALNPGGYFITAHAHLVVDEPNCPGYNWGYPFGAKVIGDTFSNTHPLQLLKELWTPLYRIQLFRRHDGNGNSSPHTPEIIKIPQPAPPPAYFAQDVLWNGGSPQYNSESEVVTAQLPILLYHRVYPEDSCADARWQVTPEAFETQLRYLRDADYYSITLEDWQQAVLTKKPLPGRAVLITFDHGYQDFLDYGWPLLQKYGFSATVFLVAEHIGGTSSWDTVNDEKIPLLGWEQIHQLQHQGVEFGSQSATHCHLTGLSFAEVVREAARSRAILQQGLRQAPVAFAYPYGDTDELIEHFISACGYTFALTWNPCLSGFQDSLLRLPRIKITGDESLEHFIAKLNQ
jgi:peptidoglycan/xylan/chitin deacetylase (PgdA/CDA1 family)/GT2 family glycosyltransferase/ubiquinone/menaquinone biosynthesis C-methylase UbiE